MPVVNAEVCYEALSGRIPAEIPRLMFWTCMLSGAGGHTYGANGIWQLNRRDQPYGKSPHGGTYGPIPWDDAMRLPGSRQLGQAKALLEQYPWYRLEPHPEWAAWTLTGTHDATGTGFEVPYAAGIPGSLRIIYAPLPRPVQIRHLEAGRTFHAFCHDPVTARRTDLGMVRPAADASWTASPPQGTATDWVLILEPEQH